MARFSRSISLPSYFYLAALIIGLLAFLIALFAQHVLGMATCAWCVFQRLILLVACFFALLAFITHQKQYNKTATTIGLISEEHTSELQSRGHFVCCHLLEN